MTKTKLFADTVLRFDSSTGEFWLMNRPDQGWGEYGRAYASIDDVEELYAVRVSRVAQQDAHGVFYLVTRLGDA